MVKQKAADLNFSKAGISDRAGFSYLIFSRFIIFTLKNYFILRKIVLYIINYTS